MIMGTEVDEVSRYLKSKSIIIPSNNYWLTSCVECFKDQGNYNLIQLKELVYQQWLLADLSDIAIQTLPDSCLTAEKVILQGRYAVQLNLFVNIAVSFHKQLQKIRKPEAMKNLEVDCENTSNDKQIRNANRIFKLEITDGVLTVVGFEDHFIPSLHEPLVPGKKAILIGPVECRKGVLFLRPSNIQVLGGEVDALHTQNATENILARALKLPENPDPYHLSIIKEETTISDDIKVNNNGFDDDDEAMMILADVIENEVSTDAAVSQVEELNNERVNLTQMGTSTSVEVNIRQSNVFQCISGKDIPNQHFASSSNDSLTTDCFDDHMAKLEQKLILNNKTESIEFDDDFELLEEEQSFNTKSLQRTESIDNSTNSMTQCQVFDIASSKKKYEQITELKKKLNESYCSNEIRPSTSGKNRLTEKSSLNSIKNEKIIIDYLDDTESPLTTLTNEFDSSNVINSSPPKVDSKNDFSFDPFPPKKRPALIKAPARVVKVLKKPKLKDDKWSVSAVVAARGIELEVAFASAVIDKIFTISAAEIISRRKELISDPVMKQKMNDTLKNSQIRFSTLACVMVFSFKDAISKPVIVDIE